jgi:hypothetical protein
VRPTRVVARIPRVIAKIGRFRCALLVAGIPCSAADADPQGEKLVPVLQDQLNICFDSRLQRVLLPEFVEDGQVESCGDHAAIGSYLTLLQKNVFGMKCWTVALNYGFVIAI